jgi:hypothetical protein
LVQTVTGKSDPTDAEIADGLEDLATEVSCTGGPDSWKYDPRNPCPDFDTTTNTCKRYCTDFAECETKCLDQSRCNWMGGLDAGKCVDAGKYDKNIHFGFNFEPSSIRGSDQNCLE